MLPGSLLAYGIVALALIAALGGAVYRIHHAGYEEGVAEVRKELQPKLDSCTAAIETQNRALAALKAEGDAKVAAATKGLQAAQKAAQGARTEAERLRALASTNRPTGNSCPAADAVSEIRRGLVSSAPPR